MYIGGAPDSRWDNDDLHNLGTVTASDFEVVQMSTVYTAGERADGRFTEHHVVHRELDFSGVGDAGDAVVASRRARDT